MIDLDILQAESVDIVGNDGRTVVFAGNRNLYVVELDPVSVTDPEAPGGKLLPVGKFRKKISTN